MLDELSVRALSRDIMKQNRVTVHPEKVSPDGWLQRCGQCSGTGPSVAGHCVSGQAVQPGSVSGWLNWS